MPTSHCSSEAPLGPRFCFQRSSPRASQSSAGLSSPSAARYFAISCAVLSLALWSSLLPWAAAPSAATAIAIARPRVAVMIRFTGSPRSVSGVPLRLEVRIAFLGLQARHLGDTRGHVLDVLDHLRLVDVARLERVFAHAELDAFHGKVLHGDLERVAVRV